MKQIASRELQVEILCLKIEDAEVVHPVHPVAVISDSDAAMPEGLVEFRARRVGDERDLSRIGELETALNRLALNAAGQDREQDNDTEYFLNQPHAKLLN